MLKMLGVEMPDVLVGKVNNLKSWGVELFNCLPGNAYMLNVLGVEMIDFLVGKVSCFNV